VRRALLRIAVIASMAWSAGSCSGHDALHPVATPPAAGPGLRLPDDVTPISYDLRLEVDPSSDHFTGSVQIRARLAHPARRFWIHAEDLDITSARSDAGPLTSIAATGDQMRAFGFSREMPAGELTLAFEFTGSTLHDEEGLFRQQAGNAWYLFSQGESVFARRILPCFDEPRWKVPWRVTLVVPADLVALANAPAVNERTLPDGRREIAFAPTPPMPSYLLALAVGPFKLVDAGTVGRAHVPVRVATLGGDPARTAVVPQKLPAIVAALEDYLDAPLPLAKLDLVAVPHLFGAMENPGLITFDTEMLIGNAERKDFRDHFVHVAAHELAHQWFGNHVTPAWWDDLWLSEAFASWLSDRIAEQLGAFDDPVLRAVLQREQAFEADDDLDARPLRRPVIGNDDPDTGFDTIAYDKGAAVLATIEDWVGEAAMRTALRTYIAHHGGGTATTADLIDAFSGAGKPEVAAVITGYVDHAGAPVVELAASCTGTPHVSARVRSGVSVPVCIRGESSAGSMRWCTVVRDRAELSVAACPTWLWGNASAGYYHVVSKSPPPALDKLTPAERIALADDLVAGFMRGDVKAAALLGVLTALAATTDPYALHAAATIARAIDPLLDDAMRPAWQAWLAHVFDARLASTALIVPRSAADRRLREDLVALVPERMPPAITKIARQIVEDDVAHLRDPDPELVAIAAPDRKLFDAIAKLARDGAHPAVQEGALEALGAFGPAFVDDAVAAYLASDAPADRAWQAVAGYFDRAPTRDAAWRATREKLPQLLAHVTGVQAGQYIEATGSLCRADLRAEVVATFEPVLHGILDGRRLLDRALAKIDRCVARKQQLGDVTTALGAAR
jgi:alanyl aminopeptidase